MEARSHIPVSLPVPNPTVPYWQDPPSSIAFFFNYTEITDIYYFLFFGSGISGASIALTLLERKPDVKIVMLEARTACGGATGRNGTFSST